MKELYEKLISCKTQSEAAEILTQAKFMEADIDDILNELKSIKASTYKERQALFALSLCMSKEIHEGEDQVETQFNILNESLDTLGRYGASLAYEGIFSPTPGYRTSPTTIVRALNEKLALNLDEEGIKDLVTIITIQDPRTIEPINDEVTNYLRRFVFEELKNFDKNNNLDGHGETRFVDYSSIDNLFKSAEWKGLLEKDGTKISLYNLPDQLEASNGQKLTIPDDLEILAVARRGNLIFQIGERNQTIQINLEEDDPLDQIKKINEIKSTVAACVPDAIKYAELLAKYGLSQDDAQLGVNSEPEPESDSDYEEELLSFQPSNAGNLITELERSFPDEKP